MPLKSVNIKDYIEKTKNWSGAKLEILCREAGLFAIREATKKDSDKVEVTKTHFNKAYEKLNKEK